MNWFVIWIKRLFGIALLALVLGAIVMAFLPTPVPVDVVAVARGPMEVAIRDDGRTRVRERYIVSNFISGQMQRVTLEVGDEVKKGETVLATIIPALPNFLDPREKARAEAVLKASEARLSRVQADLRRAGDELKQARIDLDRFQQLRQSGATTDSQWEQTQLAFRKQQEVLKSAEFQEEVAKFEVEQEQAALLQMSRQIEDEESERTFQVLSPIDGRVLKLMQESATFLPVGTPILEVGNAKQIEVIADMLSTDAIKMRPGQVTRFVHWGGDANLLGRVRLVEPSGFTKISALGVEEQRVNVIFDFTDFPDQAQFLADGFRVEVEVIVWDEKDVLKVPTSALFRSGKSWAVFIENAGVAEERLIEIGQNNGVSAQILKGLEVGETVVAHPGDNIRDGVKLKIRTQSTAE